MQIPDPENTVFTNRNVLLGLWLLFCSWSYTEQSNPDQENPHLIAVDSTTAKSFLEKAKAFHFQRNHDSARFYFQQGIAAYQQLQDWRNLSLAKQNLANHYVKTNLVDSAKSLLYESKAIFEEHQLTDTALLIRINANFIEAFNRRVEELDSGILVAQRNLELIKTFDSPQQATDLLNTYNFVSLAYRDLNFPDQAEDYVDSALLVLDQNELPNSNFYRGMLNHNKGANYTHVGDYQEALLYYELSKKALERISLDQIDINQPLTSMSNVLITLNRDEEDNYRALELLNQAEALLINSNNEKHYYMPYTYYGYVRAYINLHKYDSALYYMNKAQAINQELYGPEYGEQGYVLKTLGLIHYRKKDYEAAEGYLNRSIEVIKKKIGGKFQLTASAYMNLGKIYRDQGKLIPALKYFHQSLAYITYDFSETSFLANPALENLKANVHMVDILQNKADLIGQLYLENKDPEYLAASLDGYELISRYIDFVRKGYYNMTAKVLFNERTDTVFQKAIASVLALQGPENRHQIIPRAFWLADQRKASLLQEQIQENQARMFSAIPDSLRYRESLLKSKIFKLQQKSKTLEFQQGDTVQVAQVQEQLLQLKSQLGLTKEYLEENFSRYYQLKYQTAAAQSQDVAAQLSKDDLLIEYFIGESQLYAFILGPDYVDYLEQPLVENLEEEVYRYTQSIKNQDFQEYATSAAALYQYLLEPVLDRTAQARQTASHLIIIPDGVLGYVPFETLVQSPVSSGQSYKNLDYVIRDYQVSYHYSAGLLGAGKTSGSQHPQQPFLGFAPTFIDKGSNQFLALNERTRAFIDTLVALPNAEKEVSSIAELLQGTAQIGDAATEYNFKQMADRYKILHLASHSIIDDQEPLYSKLLFDNQYDSIDDGYLHTYELYNMQLNADLVTLSSCNTGIGKLYKGEGIMSLARGFMYAGVPNLVMSLWSVSDEPTKDLMTYFYEELNGGENTSSALRKAKLNYLRQADNVTAAPYYWGSFIYLGEVDSGYGKGFIWLWGLAIIVGVALLLWGVKRFRK